MRTLKLKQVEGESFLPHGQQLHFEQKSLTTFDLDELDEDLREQVLELIDNGVLVNENGEDPFAHLHPKRGKIYHTNDACPLSDEDLPCQYLVEGSCPLDCIHDQSLNPLAPGYESLVDDGSEGESEEEGEDPENLGEEPDGNILTPLGIQKFLDMPVSKLWDLVADIPSDAPEWLNQLIEADGRKTAVELYKQRLEEIQEEG